jgi:ubiquinone/menaquinone biosynthesis C-methylase UbiE
MAEALDPFSTVAARYDATFSDLPAVNTIRARMYDLLTRYVRPGGKILQIGCGTGVDAVWLAEHGYAVVATDPSAAMLETARVKVPPELSSLVTFLQLSAERLDRAYPGSFNAIFSNFGGLNCIQDMRSVFSQCKTLLAPRGILVLCLMNPYPLWESLTFLGTFQWQKAFRRKTSVPVNVPVGGGVVQTWYHPLRRIIACASSDFAAEEIVGLNIFSPPPSSQRFRGAYPTLVSLLERLDRVLDAIPPFSQCGDHIVVVLRLGTAGGR